MSKSLIVLVDCGTAAPPSAPATGPDPTPARALARNVREFAPRATAGRLAWTLAFWATSCSSTDTAANDVANDPRCPSAWSNLADQGYPTVCSVDGLICTYPEGQAECAPDGPDLKWWQVGLEPGCTEFPPTVGGACSSDGLTCSYITGPPGLVSTFLTKYCCDGNRRVWGIQGGFCPNGNTCGTIQASDYDQSCSKDSDCIGITVGDFCDAICIDCTNAAVNVSAKAQYAADLTSKNAGAALVCPCPSGPPVTCKAGMCSVGN
jgi:hypothetical protein